MSEATASVPEAGGDGTGAAAEILAAVETPPTETPPAAPDAPEKAVEERRAENKRLIEAERARRRAESERKAATEDRKAAEAAREEAKKNIARAESFDKTLAEARRNPGKFLEATGLTIDDLVRWKLNDGEVSPDLLLKDVEHRTSAEIKAMREEMDALKSAREAELAERAKASQEHARREAETYFQTEIDSVLSSDPDRFELTVALGEQGEVFELIRGSYIKSNGTRALSPLQAAEMIEAHLRATAEKAAGTKYYASLREKLAATSQQAAPATKAQPGKAAPLAKTSDARAKPASALTNATITSPATPVDDAKPLPTREEFVERAREKLRAKRMESTAAKK